METGHNTSENIDDTSDTTVSKKRNIQSCDEHPIIDSNDTQWDMSDTRVSQTISTAAVKKISNRKIHNCNRIIWSISPS